MPLTSSPILLDDIENNRRIAREMEARMQAASKQGVDALSMMEKLAKEGRAEERQKGLDAQQAETLKLERADKSADQARKVAQEERAAAEFQGGQMRLQRADEAEAQKARGLLIQKQVAAALAEGPQKTESAPLDQFGGSLNPEMVLEEKPQSAARALASQLRDRPDLHGTPEAEIIAEYDRQSNERMNASESRADAAAEAAMRERDMVRKEKDSAAGRVRDYAAAEATRNAPALRAEEKAATAEERKRAQTVEVENFAANIKDNIQQLKEQVAQTGTFELLGPESANMERYLTGIATDLAKLADPGSVAREGEVALQRKGIFDPNTLRTNNATALQILEALEADVDKRVANAYRVRGIEQQPSGVLTPQQRSRLDELRAKRGR